MDMKLICLLPLVGDRPFFFREHHDFVTKIKNSETDSKLRPFFHLTISDNFILSTPPKNFLTGTPMSVRNSAYSYMETLF